MFSLLLNGCIACSIAHVAISDGDTVCQDPFCQLSDESSLLQIHKPSKTKTKAPLANVLLQSVQAIKAKVNSRQDPEGCSEALSTLHDAVGTALPATYSQHAHNQNLIDIAASNVEGCATREVNGVAMVTQQAIDLEAARADHTSCRQLEDAREGEEACAQFQNLRNTHGPSMCFPLPEGDESISWVEAAQRARDAAQTALDEGRRLQEACSEFRELQAATRSQCVQDQSHFEASYCAHRASCADLEICRISAEENFISVRAEVEAAMEDVVAEFLVLKHVECLLGQANTALAEGSTVSDASCNTPASVDELIINYPTFAPIETCDPSVLTTPPCTSRFIEAEYSQFSQIEAMTDACVACSPLPLAEAPTSWVRRHGFADVDLDNLHCAEGSPAGCTATLVHLNGEYSAGPIVRIDNGITVWRSTEQDSCPPGFKIYSPSSREDWRTIRASVNMDELRSPHHIVDVTRPQNGCGGCTGHAMNSDTAAQSSWVTSDGSPWFFRDGATSEPNGDYEANCYLFVIDESNGEVTFNDGSCSYHSNRYLCQVRADNDVVDDTPVSEWTLVLQYGATAYTSNTGAVGTLNEANKQHAKMSDAAINALPSGGDPTFDYYMLTSESATAGQRDTVFLRVRGAYNDAHITLGFSSFDACYSANFDACTWQSALGGTHGIDTYYPGGRNDCSRWFTGYQNRIKCYNDQNSGGRCWSSGNACGHATRQDVKMYKKTA